MEYYKIFKSKGIEERRKSRILKREERHNKKIDVNAYK